MAVQFRQTTLENGLTLIAEVDPSAHTSALGFFVATGARDEEPAAMGVSHFLEHMMFKGTEQRTAADVDRDFDDIGANHNAFTTSEMTAFWAHCLPEHLPRATEILADILRPSLREEDFQQERSVILEEIAMYRDHPFSELYDTCLERYYGSHPLSHRVLGTEETVGGMQRDAMQAYFEHRYSADNTIVAVAGCVDVDALADQLRGGCGNWRRTDTTRVHPEFTPRVDDFTLHSDQVAQQYLIMQWPAPAFGDERRYASAILAQILGDVDGSRLYWALIESGLAEDAEAQYNGRDGLGECLLFLSCCPENAERAEQVARQTVAELIDSITDDDLVRMRSKLATGLTVHGELPAGRMQTLGRIWAYTGEYRSLEDELARVNAVTLDDLREVHDAFPMEPVVTGRLTPG